MKNKPIIISAAAIIALGVLVWLAKPGGTNPAPVPVETGGSATIEIPERSFDFGQVSMAKGNVSRTFTIRNTGSGPLSITKMFTSCMCTVAKLTIGDKTYGPYGMPGHQPIPRISASLAAGEEARVEAIFNPAAHGPAGVGRIQRVVTLENNAGAPIVFQFSAFVTP